MSVDNMPPSILCFVFFDSQLTDPSFRSSLFDLLLQYLPIAKVFDFETFKLSAVVRRRNPRKRTCVPVLMFAPSFTDTTYYINIQGFLARTVLGRISRCSWSSRS